MHLQPANILVDEHDRSKLSDFGLARVKEHTALVTKTKGAGTPCEWTRAGSVGCPMAVSQSSWASKGAERSAMHAPSGLLIEVHSWEAVCLQCSTR